MKYNFKTKQFIETQITPKKLAIVGSKTEIDKNKLIDDYLKKQFNNQ